MQEIIHYEQPLYRPPSEAHSLIFQATIGCTHNRCAFCVAYQNKRFSIRPKKELFEEIERAQNVFPDTRRIFLADGDAFALAPQKLVEILDELYRSFPKLERVTAYAAPQNFFSRTVEEIRPVREAGLTMLYFGLESGDDEVLQKIDKGATGHQMIAACQKATQAGFELSITVILGLAGPLGSKQHAQKTAEAINHIKPRYASALTLMLAPRNPSFEEVLGDPHWRLLTPLESLIECRDLVSQINADGIIFRSNHASNYLALKGDLQKDKQKLLQVIDQVLSDPNSPLLRPEFLRGL